MSNWWKRLASWQKVGIVVLGLVVAAQLSPDPGDTGSGTQPGKTNAETQTTLPVDDSPQRLVGDEPTTTSAPEPPETTTPATGTTPTNLQTASETSILSLIPGGVAATVVGVTDGDTINVQLEDGTVERLRLIGINAPEGGECMASEATSYLRDLIEGHQVGLVADVSNRDQYNRLLRYVYLGELFANEELVSNGYALAYRYEPDTAMASILGAAQTEAQESEVGMWSPAACGPAPTTALQIVEVVYDAPGDDSQNLNGEWVVIANSSDTPVGLSGWSLKDESASHRFHFPTGFVIAPGDEVFIYTGCGVDSASSLYWCNTGSAVWNNSGDTAFLLDPNGNIADQWRYD